MVPEFLINHSLYLPWYLMVAGAEPGTRMLLWRCKTLTMPLSIAHFPVGLCFKVSGLHKIPQRPAFSLFSRINNLLLLCFSLQSKEKPTLYIKIEHSIAERSVMAFSGAQSILSCSRRGLTGHKPYISPCTSPSLNYKYSSLMTLCWWGRRGYRLSALPVLLTEPPKAGGSSCRCFISWWCFNFTWMQQSPQLREGEPGSSRPN